MTESSEQASTRGEGPRAVSIHRTFVVRLFAEPGGEATADPLAGRVEHVPTREEAAFATAEELLDFLRSRARASRGGRPCA